MKIFFRLLLAHLLTDFVLQTNFIAKWKKRSFYGVVVHSLTFFVLGLVLTWEEVWEIWFDYPIKLYGIWCLIILFLFQIIEDEYRAYNIRHYHIQDNILFFLWDQVIHIVFLFVFSPYSASWDLEPIIIILCLLIIGTYGLSIIILYTDSLFYKSSVVDNLFQKKMYSIILRFVILSFFLLPYRLYLLSIVLIPIMWILNKKINFLSPISWWVNTIVVYGIGIIIFLIKKTMIM
jgi:hypothetical protein